jgi:hypothetical protein
MNGFESKTMLEAWEENMKLRSLSDDQNARMAFAAGARFALSELTDHLDMTDEATERAMALSAEILAWQYETMGWEPRS